MIGAITQSELKRLFRSPLAWTLLAVVLFLLAFLFLAFVDNFIHQIQPSNTAAEKPQGATVSIVTPVFTWAGIIMLAVLPLLTMRLVSEERQKQTWSLLAASPAKPWQIILGKYLSILFFITLACILISLMPLSLYSGTVIDGGQLFSSVFGLWLLLASLTAAGLYFSTLTSEPGTAALATFGLLLFLYVLQLSATMPGATSLLFYYLSPSSHYTPFLAAKFSSLHIIYFLLFIITFLWLSIRRIKNEIIFSQNNKFISWGKLAVGLCTIAAVAWLSAHYPLQTDISRQKKNSLPAEAVAVLKKLEGPVSITAVVDNKPEIHRRVRDALEPFMQSKKNITLEFVDIKLQRLQNKDSLDQRGQLVLEYNNKSETLHNLEQNQLISSFYRLAQGKQQWIVFLEGHGESNLLDTGSQGASKLASILKKQGYKTYSHNLVRSPTIPDNADMLVIAGAQKNFLPAEIKIITDYLQQGGALLWLHDDENLHSLEPLLEILPVEFLPGTIVNADPAIQKLIGSEHPAVFPVINYNNHPLAKDMDGQTVLAFARAVESTGQPPWQVKSFLQTLEASWNETGSLQGHVKHDADNEQGGPLSVGLSMQRPIGEQQQRIIVIGDKDFMTNELIGYGRNSELATRLFNWLGQNKIQFQISQQPIPDAKLEINPAKLNIIAVVFLLLLPLIFLFVGLWQWRLYRYRT
ncbi:MAG TPA: hypothetical protein EYH06_01185 [Chromatiales bacterium]|nr:hypothetical protein [Thiotrichales bacterium]HIP67187.1 hypothetical protein [Chromatiales bacterium]